MKKWTISQLVLIGFVTAVLFLALLAIIAWNSMMTTLEIDARSAHSKAVLIATEKVGSSMALAVAANRGYLLSHDNEVLLQHDAALEALQVSLASLGELAGNDQELQPHLQNLRQVIPARIEKMKQLRLDRGTEKVSSQLRASEGDSQRLRDILSKISIHESRLQEQYAEAGRATMRRTQVSATLLLLFLALLLAGLYLLIHRQLRRDETRIELEKNEALLRQILDVLPVGVLMTDGGGMLRLANPAVCTMLGSTPDEHLQMPDSFQSWLTDTGEKVDTSKYGIVRALQHGEITLNREFEIQRTDGQRRIVRASSMPLRDSQQRIIGAIAVNLDLTDLKRTEQALKAARDALEAGVAMRTRELVVANAQLKAQIEERRRAEDALRQTQNILTIAQRVAHVGSWEINMATQEAQWSDEFFRICGLQPGAVTPTIPAGVKLIHPDDRRRITAIARAAVQERREYSATLRVLRPDGSIRHVRLKGEPMSNGTAQPTIMIGALLDITEQLQNEEILRQLALHLQVIKEEERKRIAREIHDEMGQNLLALRIDVSMLHAHTAGTHPRLHAKVETVLANIDNTIKSVRAIINNLRPVVLDLGLHASFQWQLKEFERRTGITCELFAKADELDEGLTEEQTTTLFRILQESLTNVARHANASCVNIALDRKNGYLKMSIADDGVGMYPRDRRKSKSFGLLGIRERISAIGGELTVESVLDQGTVLKIIIPLESDISPEHGQPRQLQS